MNPLWLLRMTRWVRRPPSLQRVLLMLAVVGASLALAAVERTVGWPEALTVDGFGPAGRP
ncbi:hypothetical protein [Rhodobacter sp. NSM]|uniref:hypothetical protein n=1 Tax=Rhodobacter sp. NSM TaxID=3457501 RepID=UPI003FD4963A